MAVQNPTPVISKMWIETRGNRPSILDRHSRVSVGWGCPIRTWSRGRPAIRNRSGARRFTLSTSRQCHTGAERRPNCSESRPGPVVLTQFSSLELRVFRPRRCGRLRHHRRTRPASGNGKVAAACERPWTRFGVLARALQKRPCRLPPAYRCTHRPSRNAF